jgi:hypothetical protein
MKKRSSVAISAEDDDAPLPDAAAGPVLSFLGPASTLLGTLQLDDPFASMSQADKDALNLAGIFCGRLVQRLAQLGVGDGQLGPFHLPSVQPSGAAQLWGISASAGGAGGVGGAAAVTKEEVLLRPLKRIKSSAQQAAAAASPSGPCLLSGLPEELLHEICLSETMCSPEGGVGLSMLSRTCTAFGKPEKKGELAMLQKWAQQYCKLAGVRRLPVTMGEHWCWPRMLSWLSVGVRVGPQHGLKTIKEGIAAAKGKQDATEADGGAVVEDIVVVLVEPGVYEESIVVDGDYGPSVSVWRCDRESESNKEEMQKVEWRSRDAETLYVRWHCVCQRQRRAHVGSEERGFQ